MLVPMKRRRPTFAAETIDVLAHPFRGEGTMQDMKVSIAERIQFLAGKGASGVARKALYDVALSVPTMHVFDACAAGQITPEEGAAILGLQREAQRASLPWYVRVVLWFAAGWVEP